MIGNISFKSNSNNIKRYDGVTAQKIHTRYTHPEKKVNVWVDGDELVVERQDRYYMRSSKAHIQPEQKGKEITVPTAHLFMDNTTLTSGQTYKLTMKSEKDAAELTKTLKSIQDPKGLSYVFGG